MQTERPDEQTLELREEELVVHRDMRDVGEATIRTRVEEVPARLEVDAHSEEVEVERVPVGQVVSERKDPYQDGDVLIVPIYEEQLVVTKRLILREQLRVRRVTNTQRQLFEETLRKERAEIEDPGHTGLVREHYPDAPDGARVAQVPEHDDEEEADREQGGLVNMVRRALQ